jgi:hypothetical protein
MYERRLESSMKKTMDELHKRKLIRQLEQANKEIETDDYEMMEHTQASLGAATQLTENREQRAEDRGQRSEGRSKMTEERKYAKRTQFITSEDRGRRSEDGKNRSYKPSDMSRVQ